MCPDKENLLEIHRRKDLCRRMQTHHIPHLAAAGYCAALLCFLKLCISRYQAAYNTTPCFSAMLPDFLRIISPLRVLCFTKLYEAKINLSKAAHQMNPNIPTRAVHARTQHNWPRDNKGVSSLRAGSVFIRNPAGPIQAVYRANTQAI